MPLGKESRETAPAREDLSLVAKAIPLGNSDIPDAEAHLTNF